MGVGWRVSHCLGRGSSYWIPGLYDMENVDKLTVKTGRSLTSPLVATVLDSDGKLHSRILLHGTKELFLPEGCYVLITHQQAASSKMP
jgi:hypothetical protein